MRRLIFCILFQRVADLLAEAVMFLRICILLKSNHVVSTDTSQHMDH
jgi:hypothetical protein